MKKSSVLRWLGAVGLAVSFVLPQTSCDGYFDPDGDFVMMIPAGADSTSYTPGTDWGYVVEEMELDNPISWGWPIVFAWPLGLLLFLRTRERPPAPTWRVWLELPAIAATALLLYSLVVFGNQAWGNVVASVALGVFTLGWVFDAFAWWRSWRASGGG